MSRQATLLASPRREKFPRQVSHGSGAKVRRGIIGVLAFCVVLEIVSRSGIVSSTFLPPFSDVLVNSVTLFGREDFRLAVLETLGAWALGLGVVIVVGGGLGALFGLSEISYRLARTSVELIRPIPSIALIPLLILIFGSGLPTVTIIAVFGALWPVLFNTITGIHGVTPLAKEMARSFQISPIGIIRRVVVPSAAPFIVTGIRISSSIVLILVITVELITGGGGMGEFLGAMQAAGGTARIYVYATILLTGVLGLLLNVVMEALERRFFGWQRRQGI